MVNLASLCQSGDDTLEDDVSIRGLGGRESLTGGVLRSSAKPEKNSTVRMFWPAERGR